MGTWVYLFPRKAVTKCHKATVFKKQNLYSLTVLEGRIPRSRCQRGSPDGWWEESCASRCQGLLVILAFLDLDCTFPISVCLHMASMCYVCHCDSSYKDTRD